MAPIATHVARSRHFLHATTLAPPACDDIGATACQGWTTLGAQGPLEDAALHSSQQHSLHWAASAPNSNNQLAHASNPAEYCSQALARPPRGPRMALGRTRSAPNCKRRCTAPRETTRHSSTRRGFPRRCRSALDYWLQWCAL